MQRFSIAGPFFHNEKYINNISEKITWSLFQGDGFGKTCSNQRSSRDFNRLFFCLSAEATEFRRQWPVSSLSTAILKAPRIAWANRHGEQSAPEEY